MQAATAKAALLGSLDDFLMAKEWRSVMMVARAAGQGLLEPYVLGVEAERRWQKRRLKWIFGFFDTDPWP